jgi:hypothetical protein
MVPSSVVKDVAPPHLIAKDESKLCIPRKFDILLEKYLDNNHSSERDGERAGLQIGEPL